jgi:DNA-binding NarL/FixJ family response regulator
MANASGEFLIYTGYREGQGQISVSQICRNRIQSSRALEENLEDMPMRILIADDQAKVRFALRVLLEHQPDLEIVGEAANAQDLLAQVKIVHPDLVLLAWELPGPCADYLPPSLKEACPGLAVIALSGRPEAQSAALAAGADAFVSKGDPPDRLMTAIGDCCAKQPGGGQRTGPYLDRGAGATIG